MTPAAAQLPPWPSNPPGIPWVDTNERLFRASPAIPCHGGQRQRWEAPFPISPRHIISSRSPTRGCCNSTRSAALDVASVSSDCAGDRRNAPYPRARRSLKSHCRGSIIRLPRPRPPPLAQLARRHLRRGRAVEPDSQCDCHGPCPERHDGRRHDGDLDRRRRWHGQLHRRERPERQRRSRSLSLAGELPLHGRRLYRNRHSHRHRAARSAGPALHLDAHDAADNPAYDTPSLAASTSSSFSIGRSRTSAPTNCCTRLISRHRQHAGQCDVSHRSQHRH